MYILSDDQRNGENKKIIVNPCKPHFYFLNVGFDGGPNNVGVLA